MLYGLNVDNPKVNAIECLFLKEVDLVHSEPLTPPEPFIEKEQSVWLEGAQGLIEGVTTAPMVGPLSDHNVVALVCHPHSLHGGSMDNKVVTTLVRSFRDLGVPTLRFNFRGVGRSEGHFDNGVGESQDVLKVVAWLQAAYPGAKLILAGFSFGSAVAAMASHSLDDAVQHLILVAPPVERYSYDKEGGFPMPVTVIMGDKDELVDADGVYRWVDELSSPVSLLRYQEASHFFHGALVVLKRDLQAHILKVLL